MQGIVKWYYESGILEREVPYVSGYRHGIVKRYYESGALRRETPRVNGEKHGIERGYYKEKTSINCLTLYDKGREVAAVKI